MSATSSFMAAALREARGVLGRTSPNPAVGAVIVKDGRIVSRGATEPPGGAHAEIVALRAAGGEARGASVYVTLEPCSHHGRTPPCTDALIAAGVAEVVIAVGDPDPNVDGNGLRALREAGIAVRSGDGALDAMRHYEAYAHHRRTGRPFVTAKYAASLDGKIAASSGDSRWISSPETRAWAHEQRPQLDAILVGADTIILDDPQLTARPGGSSEGVPQPLRVVLDSRGRIAPTAQVLRDQELAPTLVATTMRSPQAWRSAIEATGARVAVFQPRNDRVPLGPLLDQLGRDGVVSLLVEGGGRVLGSFFDEGLIDKVQAVIAPLIIGGEAAGAVVGRGAERMADAVRLRDTSVRQIGPDLLISGYPVGPPPAAEVHLRIAGDSDVPGCLALVEDPAERLALESRLAEAVQRATGDGGNAWVAVVPPPAGAVDAGERVVGSVAVLWRDPDWAERADGIRRAALEQLRVAPEWRPHGVAARLLETAEAAAEARGFSYLTVLPAAAPGQDPEAGDASGLTPRQWRERGFRYYRRAPAGLDLRAKALHPDPQEAARRLHQEGR